MSNFFVSHRANLAVHPIELLHMPCKRIAIGALNGNYLVLLHALIKANIISIDRDTYLAMVALSYDKTLSETPVLETVETLVKYLTSFKVHLPRAHVQILASELAADGLNDYFTLVLLEQLKERGLEIEIICSPHSLRFLEAFYQYEANGKQLLAKDGSETSLLALNKLLQTNVIDYTMLQRIVDTVYLPALHLANVAWDPDTNISTVVCTLAASLPQLFDLSLRHGIRFDLSTPRDLLVTAYDMECKLLETVKAKGDVSSWIKETQPPAVVIAQGDFEVQFVSSIPKDKAPKGLAHNLWTTLGSTGHLEEDVCVLVTEDKKAARRTTLSPLSVEEADQQLLFTMKKAARRPPPLPPVEMAAMPLISLQTSTKRMIAIENVNIETYPVIIPHTDDLELTIGDLHGNALLLLHFLVREGVVGMGLEAYNKFVECYMTPNPRMCVEWRLEYDALVSSEVTVLRPDLLIRLIGDELSDRGNNDYYVLKLLDVLKQKGLKYEILISNHGMDFISAYEQFQSRGWTLLPSVMRDEHVKSLTHLNDWVQREIVTPAEVVDLVERSYKPHLRLLGYSLDKERQAITLYTHAAVDLKLLSMIAKKFACEFNDDSPLQLAQSIERLNGAFMRYVKKNQVYTLIPKESLMFGYYQEPFKWTDDDALAVLLWNRLYDSLTREPIYKGYSMSYAHGHDSGEMSRENIYNLDALLGKFAYYHSETYVILAAQESQLLEEEKPFKLPSSASLSRAGATLFSPKVIYAGPKDEEGCSATPSSLFG